MPWDRTTNNEPHRLHQYVCCMQCTHSLQQAVHFYVEAKTLSDSFVKGSQVKWNSKHSRKICGIWQSVKSHMPWQCALTVDAVLKVDAVLTSLVRVFPPCIRMSLHIHFEWPLLIESHFPALYANIHVLHHHLHKPNALLLLTVVFITSRVLKLNVVSIAQCTHSFRKLTWVYFRKDHLV